MKLKKTFHLFRSNRVIPENNMEAVEVNENDISVEIVEDVMMAEMDHVVPTNSDDLPVAPIKFDDFPDQVIRLIIDKAGIHGIVR